MSASDTQYADHPMSAHHVPRVVESDEEKNAREEAAGIVAFDHFSHVTPEFLEWWSDRHGDYTAQLAYIVSNLVVGDVADKAEARRLAVFVQDDFAAFVANASDRDSWPLARQIASEVRKC